MPKYITGYVKAPYLNYKASVRGPDENEKLDFDFYTENGKRFHDDTTGNMSLLGNVKLGTPFIGTNDVYIEISDKLNYYTPKTIKVASFEVVADTKYKPITYFTANYVIDDEKVELLLKAVDELMTAINLPKSIKDFGVKEDEFMANLDLLVERAFDDQCTGANPRYPLMSEIKQIFLDAYNGIV